MPRNSVQEIMQTWIKKPAFAGYLDQLVVLDALMRDVDFIGGNGEAYKFTIQVADFTTMVNLRRRVRSIDENFAGLLSQVPAVEVFEERIRVLNTLIQPLLQPVQVV